MPEHLPLNQVQAARQWKLVKLRTYTRAPSPYDDEDQDWQGYYFWANFGFVNTETEEFQKWAEARNLYDTSLNQLMQSDEGRKIWRQNGYSWIGEFILDERHPIHVLLF